MDDSEIAAKVKTMSDSGDSAEHFNALPFRVVAEHGARGYAAYEDAPAGTRYFDLDALPDDCPFPGNLTPAAACADCPFPGNLTPAAACAKMWGREPFERPRLSKKARATGFTLPGSTRQFYKVHNGLGMSTARTRGVEALLSAKNLGSLPRHPELLEVYCDSGGNRRAYPKGEDRLVDWDRSTDDRADEGSLWRLFDETLITYVTGADG